jgi:hypothetical protein
MYLNTNVRTELEKRPLNMHTYLIELQEHLNGTAIAHLARSAHILELVGGELCTKGHRKCSKNQSRPLDTRLTTFPCELSKKTSDLCLGAAPIFLNKMFFLNSDAIDAKRPKTKRL